MNDIVDQFRAGLNDGKLLVQLCGSCHRANMYPRYACPHCQSDELGWREASGEGQLMSFTVLRAGAPDGFGDELPYALGVFRLDEDVQILGRLIPDADGEWTSYRCDVRVKFVPGKAANYAYFGPAG